MGSAIRKIQLGNMLVYVASAMIAIVVVCLLSADKTFAQASPVACTGPYNSYNRQDSCGFFNNQGLDAGPDLRGGTWNPDGTWTYASGSDPGIPDDVDTAQEFINMVLSDYYTGDQRARTAAEFMILSMIGVRPTQDELLPKTVTPEQIVDWQTRILSYANIDDNTSGTGVSTGENGSITWSDFRGLSCGDLNTYYQIEYDDVTAYEVTVDNAPECVDGEALQSGHIVFADSDGNELLQIRRLCMNPTGDIGVLAAAEPNNEGTLGDLVFEDVNRDGVYSPDAGDRGIEGVTLALYNATGDCQQAELIATTTTDANGQYQFNELPLISAEGLLAQYQVVVTDDRGVLNGYASSRGQPGVDNNAQDPAGYCMTLTLTETDNQTGDFGYYRETTTAGQETLAPTGVSWHLMAVGAVLVVTFGAACLRYGETIRRLR